MANQVDMREAAKTAWEGMRAACIQGGIASDPGSWESLSTANQEVQINNAISIAQGARIGSGEALAAIRTDAATKKQECIDWIVLQQLRVGR
jgi:hypothetical protein